MREELGYEVTPKQSLDGLWRTMHKYIEHHGYSDISLELEGSQYEFRQHLQKYDEYEAKAKLVDDIITAWKTGNFDFNEGEGSLPDHSIAPVPNYHMFDFGQYVDSLLDEYESGEPNELRE